MRLREQRATDGAAPRRLTSVHPSVHPPVVHPTPDELYAHSGDAAARKRSRALVRRAAN